MPAPTRAAPVEARAPGHGLPQVRIATTSLALTGTPEARLVVFTPVSEQDRVTLERILADHPDLGTCDYHAAKAARSISAAAV